MLKLLRKKNNRELTPEETIQAEQTKISKAFGMFAKLESDVESANSNIHQAKVATQREIEALKSKIANKESLLDVADSELTANGNLLKEIKKFIPQGVSK